MAAIVYQHLTQIHDNVPISFRDHFELWLLDTEGLPLTFEDRTLSHSDFLEHMLSPAAHDAAHRQLFADFRALLAPWSFTLPHLDRKARDGPGTGGNKPARES